MYFDRHLIRLLSCVSDGTYTQYTLSPAIFQHIPELLVANSKRHQPLPSAWYEREDYQIDSIWLSRCIYLLKEMKQMIANHNIFAVTAPYEKQMDKLDELFDQSEDSELYGYLINQIIQIVWGMLHDLDDDGNENHNTAALVEAIELMCSNAAKIVC